MQDVEARECFVSVEDIIKDKQGFFFTVPDWIYSVKAGSGRKKLLIVIPDSILEELESCIERATRSRPTMTEPEASELSDSEPDNEESNAPLKGKGFAIGDFVLVDFGKNGLLPAEVLQIRDRSIIEVEAMTINGTRKRKQVIDSNNIISYSWRCVDRLLHGTAPIERCDKAGCIELLKCIVA